MKLPDKLPVDLTSAVFSFQWGVWTLLHPAFVGVHAWRIFATMMPAWAWSGIAMGLGASQCIVAFSGDGAGRKPCAFAVLTFFGGLAYEVHSAVPLSPNWLGYEGWMLLNTLILIGLH